MKDNRIILVGIVAVLVIAGVVIVFFGGRSSSGDQNIVSATDIITVAETDSTSQGSSTEVVEVNTSTSEPEQVVLTPKTELEATDPSTVNLVSGNVQFVEAFAFW